MSAMPISLADLLDLELAWKRTLIDLNDHAFVKIPNEISVIEVDLASWLGMLKDKLRHDNYHPHAAYICEIPKPKGAIRPAAYIVPEDRVVYAACVGACYSNIYDAVNWTDALTDFSTPLSSNLANPEWIRNQFHLWKDFADKSLREIDAGASHVVIADIAGYYENIDIARLMSVLRQIGAPEAPIRQLSACLNRWAQVNGRGIPQGYGSSDLLGKLYLTSVDYHLREAGYVHYRYVDDIRIFCRNKAEARKALVELITLLRERGLNIQSAKTDIYSAEEARTEIEGVQPIIDRTVKKFINEVKDVSPFNNPYITIFDAEEILSSSANDTPIEVIEDTFQTYVIGVGDKNFDKTLFRFLLKRLGKQRNGYAIDYCKNALETHPEETQTILAYFKTINVVRDVEDHIIGFLDSGNSVYPYQNYSIVEWYISTLLTPPDALISIVRRLTLDLAQPFYVHSIGRYFLGKYGSALDLEALERSYPNCSPGDQVDIICALAHMEKNRRNTFLARAEHGSDLHRRAVRLVKSNS